MHMNRFLLPVGSLLLALGLAACTSATPPTDMQRYDSPLGFSMNLPTDVFVMGEAGSVPVDAFEDPERNRTFIAPVRYGEGRQTTIASLTTDPESNGTAWTIVRTDVEDDAALDAWVKEHYGPACRVAELAPTQQEGVFDVLLRGDGLPLDETKCVLNYVYEIQYQPSHKRAFSWELGQGIRFSDGADVFYDLDMMKSFRVRD